MEEDIYSGTLKIKKPITKKAHDFFFKEIGSISSEPDPLTPAEQVDAVHEIFVHDFNTQRQSMLIGFALDGITISDPRTIKFLEDRRKSLELEIENLQKFSKLCNKKSKLEVFFSEPFENKYSVKVVEVKHIEVLAIDSLSEKSYPINTLKYTGFNRITKMQEGIKILKEGNDVKKNPGCLIVATCLLAP